MDTGSQGHNQYKPTTIELDQLFRNIYFGLGSDGLFPPQGRPVYPVGPLMDLLQLIASYELLPGIMETHYRAAWVALRLRLGCG